jgi:uncharacterized membrane protein YbaN (DUF454 family)
MTEQQAAAAAEIIRALNGIVIILGAILAALVFVVVQITFWIRDCYKWWRMIIEHGNFQQTSRREHE